MFIRSLFCWLRETYCMWIPPLCRGTTSFYYFEITRIPILVFQTLLFHFMICIILEKVFTCPAGWMVWMESCVQVSSGLPHALTIWVQHDPESCCGLRKSKALCHRSLHCVPTLQYTQYTQNCYTIILPGDFPLPGDLLSMNEPLWADLADLGLLPSDILARPDRWTE